MNRQYFFVVIAALASVASATSSQGSRDNDDAPVNVDWTLRLDASRKMDSRCQIEARITFEDGSTTSTVARPRSAQVIPMGRFEAAPKNITLLVIGLPSKNGEGFVAQDEYKLSAISKKKCDLHNLLEVSLTDASQNLYDADSSQAVMHRERSSQWASFGAFIRQKQTASQRGAATFCKVADTFYGSNLTFIYLNGETFDLGCSARCSCSNGAVACVDMCPPVVVQPQAGQICQQTWRYGQCCPDWTCVQEAEPSPCVESVDPAVSRQSQSQGKSQIAETIRFDLVACNNGQCTTSLCPVILLSERWLLITERCTERIAAADGVPHVLVSAANSPKLGLYEAKLHRNASTSSQKRHALVLLEVTQGLSMNAGTLPVNLPLNAAHCRRLTEDGCGVTVGHTSLAASAARRIEVNTAQCSIQRQQLPQQAAGSLSIHVRPDDNEPCAAQGREALQGSGLLVQSQKHQFLVALLKGPIGEGQCLKGGCYAAQNICESLDFIKTTAGL